MKRTGVYIISVDAKDIHLSNHFGEGSTGYRIRNEQGINLRRFVNSLDYSLELIKLRQVYEDVYGTTDFSFQSGNKEYTQRVINVTFKYSVKEYNKLRPGLFIKYGYMLEDVELEDHICVKNGELIAVETDQTVSSPSTPELLGKYFFYEDGVYKAKQNIKTVLSVADLRNEIYKDGFLCDGIHFTRYKRSAGSSRVGKCLFIDEALYPKMHDWELCGLHLDPQQPGDLAAFEAYISLTLSSIIDVIQIRPENILVIDDYESVFTDRVAITRVDEKGCLFTQNAEAEICNSIWDGQSLMDSSLFGSYQDKGMLLLRARFFKSCCFNANIQKWFQDNGITDVGQLNGFTLAKDIHEIKLITTPSSIKYLKFGSLEQWLSNLELDFGVVKYEKPTKYFNGQFVQTHYQLINTLQLSQDEVNAFLQPTIDYLRCLKDIPAVTRAHIKFPKDQPPLPLFPIENRNDIVFKLMGINEKFCETALYEDFVKELVKSLVKGCRCGHVLVNGNYSTICGNPIEMLQQATGTFHGSSLWEPGHIHSRRFPCDVDLLGTRSPHVACGNVLVTRNISCPAADKYLNLTNEIVLINSIQENILQRLSGCDFDSDTVLLTDNPILLEAAKRNYDMFTVPSCAVPGTKTQRKFTSEQKAALDIATSVNLIAEIINLAQELNTLFWDRYNHGEPFSELEELYLDIAQLDVLSSLEIDRAKKEFIINSKAELEKIKQKYLRRDDTGRVVRPNFFAAVAKKKHLYDSSKKNYRFHETAMDYVQHRFNKVRVRRKGASLAKPKPFSSIIRMEQYNPHKVKYSQVRKVLTVIENERCKRLSINASNLVPFAKMLLTTEARQETVDFVDRLQLSPSTMIYLLRLIELPKYSHISRDLFNILFGTPNEAFFTVINRSREKLPYIERDETGELLLFGQRYKLAYEN